MSALSERFNRLRQELNEVQSKATQFELDEQEHERVLAAISDLPEDRVCYRLVGEVLVQMHSRDAKVALEQQRARLTELVRTFQDKTHAKEEEFLAFQRENNIQIRPLREVQGAA
jgi:prefoldin subunit 2